MGYRVNVGAGVYVGYDVGVEPGTVGLGVLVRVGIKVSVGSALGVAVLVGVELGVRAAISACEGPRVPAKKITVSPRSRSAKTQPLNQIISNLPERMLWFTLSHSLFLVSCFHQKRVVARPGFLQFVCAPFFVRDRTQLPKGA